MGFRLPTFNVPFAAWHNLAGGNAYAAPAFVSVCNMSLGRRVNFAGGTSSSTNSALTMEFLVPPHTDLRAEWNGVSNDVVEAPAGSKRFYKIVFVDDVAKGFGNEYRLALGAFQINGLTWTDIGATPVPTPLP